MCAVASAYFPQLDRVVSGTSDQRIPTVMKEGYATDSVIMAFECALTLKGRHVPQFGGHITAGRCQYLPHRIEGHSCHGLGVTSKSALVLEMKDR